MAEQTSTGAVMPSRRTSRKYQAPAMAEQTKIYRAARRVRVPASTRPPRRPNKPYPPEAIPIQIDDSQVPGPCDGRTNYPPALSSAKRESLASTRPLRWPNNHCSRNDLITNILSQSMRDPKHGRGWNPPDSSANLLIPLFFQQREPRRRGRSMRFARDVWHLPFSSAFRLYARWRPAAYPGRLPNTP